MGKQARVKAYITAGQAPQGAGVVLQALIPQHLVLQMREDHRFARMFVKVLARRLMNEALKTGAEAEGA